MNSRKTQPTNPQSINTLSEIKGYLQKLHNDMYPQYQSLPQNVPTINGLSNGKVTGGNVRQGRNWTVSLTIVPLASGPSVASSASLTLPFVAANTSTFTVTFGNTILAAQVSQGSTTLNLPNWSTVETVTIYGKADE